MPAVNEMKKGPLPLDIMGLGALAWIVYSVAIRGVAVVVGMRGMIECLVLSLICVLIASCNFRVPDTPVSPGFDAQTSLDTGLIHDGMVQHNGDAQQSNDGAKETLDSSTDSNPNMNVDATACTVDCEECNGIDDDGDDRVDEGPVIMVGQECSVTDQFGVCASGEIACSEGNLTCESLQEPEDETCDEQDNDCDGNTDEGVQNDCGACGAAPLEMCNDVDDDCDDVVDEGVRNACGGCGDVPEDVCDGVDNDCNGTIDDTCPCVVGTQEACGSGVGECARGTRTCIEGQWGPCEGAVGPQDAELCDSRDNDCDGVTDEDLTVECGSAVGVCTTGTQRCINGQLTACAGERVPVNEVCDGLDNDCDDSTDEELVAVPIQCGVGACQRDGERRCRNGALVDDCRMGDARNELCDGIDNDCDGQVDEALTRPCGSDIGACQAGAEICDDGEWGACEGQLGPTPELCDDVDNDCDDRIDEEVAPAGSQCGIGACRRNGQRLCVGGEFVDDCQAAAPQNEICDNIDNDCDGSTDEAVSERCGSDVGECTRGTRVCVQGDFGACVGEVVAANEVCDNADNDCDGSTDESISERCGSDVGECTRGTRVCVRGDFGACVGEVIAANEVCDNADNDCDGSTDESISERCGSDVGECTRGTRVCVRGEFGACAGEVVAAEELCDNADNDCDGNVDETITRVCGSNVGECEQGLETCAAGVWGNCQGHTPPGDAEGEQNFASCNGLDDDCDGRIDEDFAPANGCFEEVICRNGSLEFCGFEGRDPF